MRKLYVLIVSVVLFGLLVSCSSKSVESPVSGEEQEHVSRKNSIRMLYSGTGGNSVSGWCISDHGLYEISDILGTQNIIYSDLESEKAVFLCSNAGCDHMHEGCTSFLPVNGFLLCDDNIWYISFVSTDRWGGRMQQFCVMGPDGNGRKVFRESNDSDMYGGAPVCVDDNSMYTVLENNGEEWFSRIDLENGNAEHLFQLEEREHVVTAFDRKILTQYFEPYDRTAYLGPVRSGLREYDMETGESRTVFMFPEADIKETSTPIGTIMYRPVFRTSVEFDGSNMYYMDTNDSVFHIYDLRTGTQVNETDLKEYGISGEAFVHCSSGKVLLCRPVDESIPDDHPRYYVLDLADGNLGEIGLTRHSQRYHIEEPFDPLGYSGDKIVFRTGGQDYQIRREMPDGTYELDTLPLNAFAYITMDDVLNGNIEVHTMEFVGK